jgi:hypothetical protein
MRCGLTVLLVVAVFAGGAPSASAVTRFGFTDEWRHLEPRLGWLPPGSVVKATAHHFQDTAAVCSAIAERNLRPLVTLYAPGLDWDPYLREKLASCPQAIAWEVWNEPNLPGDLRPSPSEYAARFRAVREIAPNARLITAGMAPLEVSRAVSKRRGKQKRQRRQRKRCLRFSGAPPPPNGPLLPIGRARDWRSYLRHLRDRGVFEIADGVGYHVYPDHPSPRVVRGVRSTVKVGRRITGVRSAWITEVSSSSLFGDRVQAKRQRRYWRSARRVRASAFIVFRLVDAKVDSPYFSCSGALRRAGSPKPVFRALRNEWLRPRA